MMQKREVYSELSVKQRAIKKTGSWDRWKLLEGGGTAGEQLRAPGRVPQVAQNVPHPCSVVVLKTHKPRLGLPAFSPKGISFEGQYSRIQFALWKQPWWSHRVGICISRILVARHRLHGIAGTALAGSALSPLGLQAPRGSPCITHQLQLPQGPALTWP